MLVSAQTLKKVFFRLLPFIFFGLTIWFLAFFWPTTFSFLQKPLSSVGSLGSRFFGFQGSGEVCLSAQSFVAKVANDQASWETTKTENEQLKALIGFFERSPYQQITARVLSRSISPTDIILIIDRGAEDGVRVGSAIVVENGQVIGKVSETKKHTAVVRSLLSTSSSLAVSLLNNSHTIGLTEGTGSALLTLRFVPQDETISINDLVVTSGLEANIPAGLVVGVVTGVFRDLAAPFQEATIEPLVDARFFSLVSVLILPSEL